MKAFQAPFLKFCYGVTSMNVVSNNVDFVAQTPHSSRDTADSNGFFSVCNVRLITFTTNNKVKHYLTVLKAVKKLQ